MAYSAPEPSSALAHISAMGSECRARDGGLCSRDLFVRAISVSEMGKADGTGREGKPV